MIDKTSNAKKRMFFEHPRINSIIKQMKTNKPFMKYESDNRSMVTL